MRQRICAIFLILAGTAAAFGAELSFSAGAGGSLGGFFSRYTLSADGMVDGNQIKVDAGQEHNQLDYGFFGFIDATYAEFSFSYQRGSNTWTETFTVAGLDASLFPSASSKGWETVLGFSLLGKYPFQLNEQFSVFPLLGVEYQISLMQRRARASDGWVYDRANGLWEMDKDGNAYSLRDWNSFWIKLGGGIDVTLFNNIFLRGELLYGFRTMTPYEIKNLDRTKSLSGDPNPKLGGVTNGPSLRISAGYRFN
ncbi:MAG: hypothetical protein LBI06_07205 [Treponema sp.]|jgi:hypothetical protein|nr:hypothetical protein [Treponema sp.]